MLGEWGKKRGVKKGEGGGGIWLIPTLARKQSGEKTNYSRHGPESEGEEHFTPRNDIGIYLLEKETKVGILIIEYKRK